MESRKEALNPESAGFGTDFGRDEKSLRLLLCIYLTIEMGCATEFKNKCWAIRSKNGGPFVLKN